jgi:hypothetical protein
MSTFREIYDVLGLVYIVFLAVATESCVVCPPCRVRHFDQGDLQQIELNRSMNTKLGQPLRVDRIHRALLITSSNVWGTHHKCFTTNCPFYR